jgi:hypothetical protein
MALLGICP